MKIMQIIIGIAIGLQLTAIFPAYAYEVYEGHEAVDLEAGPALAEIGTDEMRALLSSGIPVLIVDARGPEVYAQGHLPGAVNLPADRVENLGVLIPKSGVVVVYCGGPQCPHSTIVGRWLLAHGWPWVLQFTQGYPGWQAAGLPVESHQ